MEEKERGRWGVDACGKRRLTEHWLRSGAPPRARCDIEGGDKHVAESGSKGEGSVGTGGYKY